MIILHEQKTPVYVAVAVNACIRVGCNRPLMRFSPTKICVIQFRRLSSQALYSQIGCNRKSKLFFDGLFFPLHTKSMKPFLLAWYNQYDTEIWATKNIFKKMQKKLRFKLCFVSQLYKKLLSAKWNFVTWQVNLHIFSLLSLMKKDHKSTFFLVKISTQKI